MINSSHKIVKLQLEDAQILYKLESQAFSDAWSIAQFEKALVSKNYLFFGIKSNEEPDMLISYISLSVIPSIDNMLDGEFEVINVATSSKFKKQGYAKELLSYVIAFGAEHSIASIFLDVRESNLPAYNLYKKLNFNEISRRKNYYETANGCEDAILMSYTYVKTT